MEIQKQRTSGTNDDKTEAEEYQLEKLSNRNLHIFTSDQPLAKSMYKTI